MDALDIVVSNVWAQIALAAMLIGVIAGVMERRRGRRKHIDAVGFMPWPMITVLSALVAIIAAAMAIVQP